MTVCGSVTRNTAKASKSTETAMSTKATLSVAESMAMESKSIILELGYVC